MVNQAPVCTDAVRALMNRNEDMVPAAAIAPIVGMNPGRIVAYAKEGRWNFCSYVVSGERVKFCRMDFLRRMGFIQDKPEPEVMPQAYVLNQVIDELKQIRQALEDLRAQK